MKRLIPLLVCSFIMFSACSRDAAQLTVVTGIGVDGAPGEYQVAAEVIRLSSDQENGQSTYLYGDGLTLTGSIDRMVSGTGRTLYCNHVQVLLVNRETAEKGLGQLMEELLRGNQYPVSLRMAVCKDSAAKSVSSKSVISEIHSVELEDIIREGAEHCLNPDMDICNFYQEVSVAGVEGILPFIELRENHGEQVCALSGTALFRGEKMIGVLNEKDSQILMWMRGKSGGTLVTENAVFEVEDVKRTLMTTKSGGKIKLSVTLKASDNEENREALIQEAEFAMEEKCLSLLERLQQLECDAVGIGNHLYRCRPKDWAMLQEDWSSCFAEYPIQVEVTVKNMIWGRIWSTGGEQSGEGNSQNEQ